jgi:hypothetical protein
VPYLVPRCALLARNERAFTPPVHISTAIKTSIVSIRGFQS